MSTNNQRSDNKSLKRGTMFSFDETQKGQRDYDGRTYDVYEVSFDIDKVHGSYTIWGAETVMDADDSDSDIMCSLQCSSSLTDGEGVVLALLAVDSLRLPSEITATVDGELIHFSVRVPLRTVALLLTGEELEQVLQSKDKKVRDFAVYADYLQEGQRFIEGIPAA